MIQVNWKVVAVYAGAAVLGECTGAFVAEMVIRTMHNKELDRVMNEQAKWERYKENSEANKLAEPYQPPAEEKEGPIVAAARDMGALPPAEKKRGRPAKVVDYTTYSKKAPINTVAKELLGERAVEETEVDPTKPHIITVEEYDSSNGSFGKVTLSYYAGDDTLCGADEKIINAPDELLGGEALTNFGQDSNDADIVYVRDPRTSTDYEVIQLHATYTETVLGILPDKPKAGKATRSRTRKVKTIDEDDEQQE